MLDFNQLEQLICIAENGTISNAAKKLLISQPALSRSMQRLEEDLNLLLFDHYKNKVVLNKNGELMVKYAKKMIADRNKMIDDIQAFNRSHQSISIACCTPAPIWDLEPILKTIYPNIQITSDVIQKDDLLHCLKENKYSLIITPEEVNDKEYLCYPYIEEDLFLSVPKEHPFANKTEITFKEIDGLTMLLYSNIGFWYDLHLQTTPNARFLIQSERSAFNEIVKASTLPSFTSNLSIKREGQPENRNVVTITDESAHVTFYLVIKKQDKSKYDDLINTIENYYDF